MSEEVYNQGFLAKCAEYGVDPEAVVKSAQEAPPMQGNRSTYGALMGGPEAAPSLTPPAVTSTQPSAQPQVQMQGYPTMTPRRMGVDNMAHHRKYRLDSLRSQQQSNAPVATSVAQPQAAKPVSPIHVMPPTPLTSQQQMSRDNPVQFDAESASSTPYPSAIAGAPTTPPAAAPATGGPEASSTPAATASKKKFGFGNMLGNMGAMGLGGPLGLAGKQMYDNRDVPGSLGNKAKNYAGSKLKGLGNYLTGSGG